MKVEFLVNADINDGRQIFIQESEFRKAKNNDEEVRAIYHLRYKHIRCTIYVYKHGTKTLISGADDKLHFRQHEVFSFRISKYHSLFFFLANHC